MAADHVLFTACLHEWLTHRPANVAPLSRSVVGMAVNYPSFPITLLTVRQIQITALSLPTSTKIITTPSHHHQTKSDHQSRDSGTMADHPPKPAKDGVPSQGSSSDNTPQIQPIKTQEKTTPPQGKTTNLEWLTVMFAAAREKARNRTPEERQEFYRSECFAPLSVQPTPAFVFLLVCFGACVCTAIGVMYTG
ncbi:hypothetical protein CONLIGDRAFT_494130 [Coniochaeta ligniaria NRRL 30616]|uniref:Uncharacterized protein n=1 Tax=Coniochaeta ligniaria NRRL 30616 TaxID=1408157 RepID=A0A1J7IHW8_9PEZI|nr:hypothetical protein CONLIGDRAFT_494130 [Coniochaeta ligniaria NRRL 30616]